jgi:hypothetical protein
MFPDGKGESSSGSMVADKRGLEEDMVVGDVFVGLATPDLAC